MAERFIAPHLLDASYSGVETLEAIAKEIGLQPEQIVKLNANENAFGTPDVVLQAMLKVSTSLQSEQREREKGGGRGGRARRQKTARERERDRGESGGHN